MEEGGGGGGGMKGGGGYFEPEPLFASIAGHEKLSPKIPTALLWSLFIHSEELALQHVQL